MRKGDPEQQRWGNAINVVLPKFKNSGTHVNVSGAVVSNMHLIAKKQFNY